MIKPGLVSVHVHSMVHQLEHGQAALSGFKRHGINVQFAGRDITTDADVSVIWGWKQHRVIEHTGARGGRVLVMERGYLPDRMEWTSMGWGGLNGRATFAPCLDKGERFAAHWGRLVKPWKTDGEYTLLCGQVPSDSSVKGIQFDQWAQSAADELRRRGEAVVFRPHPVVLERFQLVIPGGAVRSRFADIDEDLADARCAVTYNSNAGVDAAIRGVPIVAVDPGSMAWPVASHSFDDPLRRPDRTDWMCRLAWSQFTLDEIASGFAWEAVRQARV